MDIIELTRQLGAELQKDERYKAFDSAKKANDNDEALQAKIGEFNLIKANLDRELSSEKRDDGKINSLNDQLGDVYREIMSNPLMMDYNDARTQLDGLLNEINSILMLCANGEDPKTCQPSSCGGDCASCGGCH